MPNFRFHSVATVCKLSLGSPTIRAGDSRRSLSRGMRRAKTRRTWKPTESAQLCNSFSSRSRANTFLKEIRTSLPKRSTQPCSIVQSRCASVPSDWKSRSKPGSIHPVIIPFRCSNGIVRNRHGATDGLPGNAALLHCRGPHGGGATMQQVTVRVPASTSNLGPGYDCLGVALCLHNSVTVVRGNVPRSSHPRIVSDAAERFFKQTRRRVFSFSCSTEEQVPRCRGLGSSATVRLGVLVGLNRLSGDPLDRLSLFRLCAELEGHPDNAAPASFGGFTVVNSRSISLSHGKQYAAATVHHFDVA